MLITIDTEQLRTLLQVEIARLASKTRSETPFMDRVQMGKLHFQYELITELEQGVYNEAVKTVSADSIPQSTN